MDPSLLDHPLLLNTLFYPRAEEPHTSRVKNAVDGTIPVAEGVALGYRLFRYEDAPAVMLYWHGNGETAADYDEFAAAFRRAGASLMVVDYRGYGWSSGRPKFSTLLGDAERVGEALLDILRGAGLGGKPVLLMGRSLGSAPAIHLASQFPEQFKGLIVESGFGEVLPLLARLGLPVQAMGGIADPIGNLKKVAQIEMPLLVIHGEIDSLIPVANGQALYDASGAAHRRILRVRGAGHNDLLMVAAEQYFDAVAAFIRQVTG